jgi:hypothetical protein
VHDLGAGLRVRAIGEEGACPGARLDQHRVAGGNEVANAVRHQRHAAFTRRALP